MKKKFLLTLLATVCALGCAFGLAACGGGKGKITISMPEFTDKGIVQIRVSGIPSETSTAEDFDQEQEIDRQYGALYNTFTSDGGYCGGGSGSLEEGLTSKFFNAKFNKGKWSVGVEIQIFGPYTLGDLKIDVNGEEIEFTSATSWDNVILGKFYGLTSSEDRYFAFIDEPISSDTQITLKGHTQAKPYSVVVDYSPYYGSEYNPENELHSDFVFKYAVNDGNMSDELSVVQLKAALEAIEDLDADDKITIVGYFKTLGYRIESEEDAKDLIMHSTDAKIEGNQVIWTANYRDKSLFFDYTVLDGLFGNNN